MNKAITYLRSPSTIRSHCHQLLDLAREDQLSHFRLEEAHLPDAISYVQQEIATNYPDHRIPYHSRFRHFEAGGINRIKELKKNCSFHSTQERGMALFELAIISVLLDAGAGETWSYLEQSTQNTYTRSEGLAIASLHMFTSGLFSSVPSSPLQVDAKALTQLDQEQLAHALQVTKDNPLIGLQGRTTLLNQLGHTIHSQPHFFATEENPRLGGLYQYLISQSKDGTCAATDILHTVLEAFSAIWPNGYHLHGINIGDVGVHPLVKGPFGTDGLIPFHKLSQWISYSLFEPLEEAGITITQANELTGLPEYRNGGLLIDSGVLQVKNKKSYCIAHSPQSEFIVEWRGLTVALLDLISHEIRNTLHKTKEEFPLVKVLQGGTWSAGRKIAAAKRINGSSPIHIQSDGTIF